MYNKKTSGEIRYDRGRFGDKGSSVTRRMGEAAGLDRSNANHQN